MVEEPHAPANADAGVAVEAPEAFALPADDDPAAEVLPAAPPTPEGDVGTNSSDDCSNAQPVASADASNRLIKEIFFMIGPYSFVSAHTFLVCAHGPFAQNSSEIEESA